MYILCTCHETTQVGPLVMCFHPNVKGPLSNEELRISKIYSGYDPSPNSSGVFLYPFTLFPWGNISFLFMGFANF